MATQVPEFGSHPSRPSSPPSSNTGAHPTAGTRFLAPIGRALFVAIFLQAVPAHFSQAAFAYAASAGVPLPSVTVPLSGMLAALGALSVLFGYKARVGAWILILFLVPVTFLMHKFWAISDPMTARLQEAMFMKNVSMMGGALLIAYFGAGPISVDEPR